MGYKKEALLSQRSLNWISKDINEVYVKAMFGPSKVTRIPLVLDSDLAFFVAAIIGDGHLKREKFQISIELSNKALLKYIREICLNVFKRKFNILPIKLRKGKKPTFIMRADSKAIYNLLNKAFGIPAGKKSHIVKIPSYIFSAKREIKLAFLHGILLTEGGRRRRGIGLSTASKELWKGLIRLFKQVGVNVKVDKWEHKIYKKEYYGLVFKKEEYLFLLRGGAGAVKRDRSLILS